MTERAAKSLVQSRSRLAIGPSALTWDGEGLLIEFDEVAAPIPSRLKGSLRLRPTTLGRTLFALDPDERHRWRPIAPHAEVEVHLDHPGLKWRGEGYFDANFGDEPLEDAFRFWAWSRGHTGGETTIHYDLERRDGACAGLALRLQRDGAMIPLDPPPFQELGPTFWRVARPARLGPGQGPATLRTLEDTPFYTRTALDWREDGEVARMVHESLDLDRLRSPLVRVMLPFRMPRSFW